MLKKWFSGLLFIACGLLGHAQLTLQIYGLPPSTPEQMSIFVAGNFNNWNPGDPAYQLQSTGGNMPALTLYNLPAPFQLEFKCTGGSWEAVEGDANGNFLQNRRYEYNGGPDTLRFAILSWERLDPRAGSTAGRNVHLVSKAFEIPQLGRTRRVWVYLPPDYATSGKRYPVLYMQDGQNLFDRATSFSGEWQVDETLDAWTAAGRRGCIVVGIDNGGERRISEYSPWPTRYGPAEGKAFAAFLAETLKPYIDQNYRTLRSRRHTGVMGSSMGGLISLYTAVEYQKTFGFAGIFSPSLWITPEWQAHIRQTGKRGSLRFYLLAGKGESDTMEQEVWALAQTLQTAGFHPSRIWVDIDDDGAHSEWYWARELPNMLRWWLEY